MAIGAPTTLFTVGHSNKTLDDLLAELQHFAIEAVIDVRSYPHSRRFPHFNKAYLQQALPEHGIAYHWWGHLLGGRPRDAACYTDSRIDYAKLRTRPYFQEGIRRLVAAHRQGKRWALLCSEGNPARCHRALLIGEELRRYHDIHLQHIVRHPKTRQMTIKPQLEVIREAFPHGTRHLF